MTDAVKNRVAVVTGAGSGLGRTHAKGLAARGFRVVVNDIGTSHDGKGTSEAAADKVVEDIEKAGGTAIANYDSVTEEEGANNIIQSAIDSFGRIDVMINNAGIIRLQPVWDIRTEDWDAMVKTHLYGTFFCTRAACRIMKEQGYGRIINTSSHIGLGFEGHATYSAVKEGIVGFSRSVARDMGKYGVTCNIIRPIAAWRGAENKIEEFENKRPEDVSAFVVYLASEEADHINGCIFEVYAGHIGIFTDPPPVEKILYKDGQWTFDELVKVIPETLTMGRSREEFPYTLPFKLSKPL